MKITREQMHLELFPDAPKYCPECHVGWNEDRKYCVYCSVKLVRRDARKDGEEFRQTGQ